VSVSGRRGTVGHNWGAEHADCWVWLHAAGFGTAPQAWLELVLARIRAGPARSPWTAMGAHGLGGRSRRAGWAGGPGSTPLPAHRRRPLACSPASAGSYDRR
jgi:hypothetical protein